jgi:ParB family chromosome partitioning protein
MAKTAINAKRGNIFMVEPERLTLVTDKDHPLYDPRVEDMPDENMILNIAKHGVLEPVLVRKNGDDIEVIAGRRRTKAATEANRRLTAEGKLPLLIPIMIRGGTDADLFGVLISENEIRRNDTMIHKGEKARKLLNMGYDVNGIAVTFGVSRQAVDSWLTVQQMPEPIKEAVEAGEVSATAVLHLAGFSRDEQVERFKDLMAQGAKTTVANVRSAAASTENKPAPKMKTRAEIERKYEYLKADHYPGLDYSRGQIDILHWVLGLEGGAEA